MRFTVRFWLSLGVALCMLIGFTGCGKENVKYNELSPEDQFAQTKRLFDKKDYYKAKMQFTVLVLNHPGSAIVESTQYYLAECHFFLKEYLLAVAEYEKLIKSLPQSDLVDDARYRTGLCYEKLSPSFGLDQEYTYKAINQYQLFLDDYPDSDLRPVVEAHLSACREKVAKKEYKMGELYRKMGYDTAAVISFNAVLDNYGDTSFADDALFWKAECLRKLDNRPQARNTYETLIATHPNSVFAERARNRLKDLSKRRR